jgi:drug/metabolite transporter (DMT)-like permease
MTNTNKITNKSNTPFFALLCVQLCFGSLPTVGKIVLQKIPALSLVGFRVGIATLIIVLIQVFKKDLWLKDKKDYYKFAILSLFGVSLNQLFFIGGLSLTKASNSALLAVTIPIFALIISVFLKTERLRKIKIIGILIALFGVLLLIDPRKASFSSETTLGDFMIIINSFCYGIYVVTSKETILKYGAIKSTAWIFFFGSLICVPLGLYSFSSVNMNDLDWKTWAMVLHIGIVCTTLPYLLISWSLARVNPSTVAVFVYLQPLIGFSLAVLFLGEQFTQYTIFAAILIFIGVYFATKKHQTNLPPIIDETTL